MKTQSLLSVTGLVAAGLLVNSTAFASETGWFVKPMLGLSQLSDQTANAVNTSNFDGNWDVAMSSGIAAGLGLGYQYNDNWSAEVYWEYRSNDSDTTVLSSGDTYSGNYASSIIYLNGYYHFDSQYDWQWYVGGGLGWTQEIDLDLEDGNIERSFSGDGDISAQVMLGADYQIAKDWTLNTEIRYSMMSSIDLDGEENVIGQVSGLDYNPLTVGIAVKYSF